MCNEAARRIALGQLREDWAQLKVPLVFPEGLPNLAPLESIRITDATLILRAGAEGGAEGVTRCWSWPGPSGKPVYNFRSEGRAFANAGASSGSPQSDTLRGGAGRCLIPVDAFFEFTDPAPGAPKRARKSKWRFTATDADWFCVAGWWRRDPGVGEAFTMLTCEPGPDIAPYHGRQIVLPPRAQWAGWLDGSLPAREVCRPAAGGRFAVAAVG
jgi:putative SOS response-associated peptidase YedK